MDLAWWGPGLSGAWGGETAEVMDHLLFCPWVATGWVGNWVPCQFHSESQWEEEKHLQGILVCVSRLTQMSHTHSLRSEVDTDLKNQEV